LDTAGYEEHIGLLIAAARRRIKQAVGERVRGYALTAPQFWVLVAIDESRGISPRELASRLRMDEPTASRVVTALLVRKLVRVEAHRIDRRRSCLHLDVAGANIAPVLAGVAAEIRTGIARGLSGIERDALRAGLQRVIANMDRLGEGAHGPRAASAPRVPSRAARLRSSPAGESRWRA